MASASRSTSSRGLVTSQATDREARPRKRVPPDQILRQTKLQPQPPHFVFEQIPERLDELKAELRGKAADVVVQLDGGGWPVERGATFDHIRIERPLCQEASVLDFLGLFLEAFDERVSDAAAFFLRLGDAFERFQESLFAGDNVEVRFEVPAELGDDRGLLLFAEQAIVHQYAGEPRSNRPVEQRRGDGRIDSAGEPADDAAAADPFPHLLDGFLGKIPQPP